MPPKIRIKDIAKELGVSSAAVSLALNNKSGVSSDLKARIVSHAAKSGYIQNAGSLKSDYVAVVYDISEGLVPLNIEITQTLKKNGFFELRYAFYSDELLDDEKQRIYFNKITDEDSVAGLIIVALNISELLLNRLLNKNIPIVLVNCKSKHNLGININIDDELGGYLAAKKLIELGHRNIGLILPDVSYDNVWNERKAGYKNALLESGLKYNIDYLEPENTFTVEEAGKATMNLVRRHPELTAIIYVTDLQAVGGMRAMKQNGIKIPDDISVIGFDNSKYCELVTPTLSSAELHLKKIGSLASEMLLKAMRENNKHSESIIMRPEIILRDSCRSLVK
ncbi:MAG: LacI family DNA-binding transcriptional regulator [Elusimicrobiota bacterium]